MVLAEAEVPFAHQAGRIAGGAQQVGERALVERQAEFAFGADVRVELMPEARLVAAREQAGPRRTAIRCGDVAVRAADAGPRQLVDVWRRHGLAAVYAN